MPALIRSALWVLCSVVFLYEIMVEINSLQAAGQYVSPWRYFGTGVFMLSLLFSLWESWKSWKRYHADSNNG
jgi:hypothetical protein